MRTVTPQQTKTKRTRHPGCCDAAWISDLPSFNEAWSKVTGFFSGIVSRPKQSAVKEGETLLQNYSVEEYEVSTLNFYTNVRFT